MVSKQVPLTKDGMDKLQKELDELVTVRRAEVAQKIHDAKELVGAQNAPEYEDVRAEQAFVEGRIQEIESMLQNAVMIDHKQRSPEGFAGLQGQGARRQRQRVRLHHRRHGRG